LGWFCVGLDVGFGLLLDMGELRLRFYDDIVLHFAHIRLLFCVALAFRFISLFVFIPIPIPIRIFIFVWCVRCVD